MVKRARLEIIFDILKIILDNKGVMKQTPLLRKSNLSSARFKEYFSELKAKGFVVTDFLGNQKLVKISDKGRRFVEKYHSISNFITEFDL
jgi:predicted transcriptional regulator